jgi:cephalosporin hydroxylase
MMAKKILALLINEIKRIRGLIYHKMYVSPKFKKDISTQFHRLYYDSFVFDKFLCKPYWLGVPLSKCPLDLWIYQEIIFEARPDIIVECGTLQGGSALYLASMCDIVRNGEIVTIDIEESEGRPQHKRIRYLHGSSTSAEIVETVKKLVKDKEKILVLLDSDHHKEHVLNELRIYSKFVTIGSYIIVEDTNIHGHPVRPDLGPGPMEAVDEFLKENKDFIIDTNREKFYLSFNPKGYLKRIK